MEIRTIQEKDDQQLALIIRQTLTEFNAAKPGTVYFDPTTDHLSELFKKEKSCYFVLTDNDKLLGGAGVFPTNGLPPDTAELVKLYLLPEARGLGMGRHLINKCFESAKSMGFENLYLESMPELSQAIGMYTKLGFVPLEKPMGNSGHHGCDIWMLKNLID